MIWLTSVLLLAASAALLWWNRPAAGWPGAAAARFAAALITALYAVLAPLPYNALSTSQLLLEQLSLYAALPLLLSVALSTSLGYDWSRMIWGRVLLVWCVVFELCRSNAVLPELWLGIVLGGAIVMLLPLIISRSYRTGWLPAAGWAGLAAVTWLQPDWSGVSGALMTALILIFINAHSRQNPAR